MDADISCPRCNSDVLYKYGKAKNGKQRYSCQLCNRQFVFGKSRLEVKKRPGCPRCGQPMYIYMRGDSFIRFRCSNYPKCRTFIKLTKEVALVYELLHP